MYLKSLYTIVTLITLTLSQPTCAAAAAAEAPSYHMDLETLTAFFLQDGTNTIARESAWEVVNFLESRDSRKRDVPGALSNFATLTFSVDEIISRNLYGLAPTQNLTLDEAAASPIVSIMKHGFTAAENALLHLTQDFYAKVQKLYPNKIRQHGPIELADISGKATGKLIFFKDDAQQFAPAFVWETSQWSGHYTCNLNYFGHYNTPTHKVHAFIFNGHTLETRPGVFFNHYLNHDLLHYEFAVYYGDNNPTPYRYLPLRWLADPEVFPILEQLHNTQLESSRPKHLSESAGTFIPFTDHKDIQALISQLLDFATLDFERTGSRKFFDLLDIISDFQLTTELASTTKKSKRRPRKKGKPQATPAVDIAPSTADSPAKEASPALIAEAVEHEDSAGNLSQAAVAAAPAAAAPAEPDDEDVVEKLETTTLQTPKQLKDALLEQVLETIPNGQIKQRVLDRLITQWLEMTRLSETQIRTFVSGSEKKHHVGRSGFTSTRRHRGSGRDTTFAPYEVRSTAKQVVNAAFPEGEEDVE